MYGHRDILALVNHFKAYLYAKVNVDVTGAEIEWQLVKAFILKNDLLANCKVSILEFWKPIVCNKAEFPLMHLLLRLVLAMSPGSCVVERLFHLLNRVNRLDKRRLTISTLESMLLIAKDN